MTEAEINETLDKIAKFYEQLEPDSLRASMRKHLTNLFFITNDEAKKHIDAWFRKNRR